MKNIIIVGANSYIGNSFKEYIKDKDFIIKEIDTMVTAVNNMDFSGADCVIHLAGIAHVSSKISKEQYYKINRDLAINIAEKAKKDNAKQFIFMSSMIIYGNDGKIRKKNIITKDTLPNPRNAYGQSKFEADIYIQKMNSDYFKTVIIRSPMVYGPNCKGNFPRLINLALKLPVFPKIKNERSMIYIDNLCEFFLYIIKNNESGIFFPQNNEYISSIDIVRLARLYSNKKPRFICIFNPFIYFASHFIKSINKVFGNKTYDKNISTLHQGKYAIFSFGQAMEKIMHDYLGEK